MTTRDDILTFASRLKTFTIKDLFDYFQSSGIEFKPQSVKTQMSRLVKSNILIRVDKGVYALSKIPKPEFKSSINGVMIEITEVIRASYPFLDICVWSLDDIKDLSHYAAKRDVVYVEVDRDAIDGVFNLLSESFPAKRVFVNPTEREYTYYINGTPANQLFLRLT